MAREKLLSIGFDEPGESSVLLQVPENARTWFLEGEEGEWSYCIGVTDLSKQKVGFHIGPRFRCDTSEPERLLYECRARWSAGSVSISLTSGLCASTKEAFERVCVQAQTLPSGEALNWSLVLLNELGFRGMNAPRFENTTELGLPTIVCTLSWGNPTTRLEVCSRPCQNRIHAFEDAVERAKVIGPAPEPVPPVRVTSPINWERAARIQVQNKGSIGDGQLKVSFLPSRSGNTVSCKIRWGRAMEHAVESFPMPNQAEAFAQAVQIFKRDVFAQMSQKEKSRGVVAQVSPGIKVTDPLDAQAKALLDRAKRHWSVEREWLMGGCIQTKERVQRLHDLNTFLVLLDPLRCYEIDRGARDVAIGRITVELQRIHSDQNKLNTSIRHAAQLRSLLGQRFAEAGAAVIQTSAFATYARSSGVKPEQAIAELVQAQLLRQLASGELTISTLGANLLERNLNTEIRSGSLGSALPQGVALVLLNLKDSLLAAKG